MNHYLPKQAAMLLPRLQLLREPSIALPVRRTVHLLRIPFSRKEVGRLYAFFHCDISPPRLASAPGLRVHDALGVSNLASLTDFPLPQPLIEPFRLELELHGAGGKVEAGSPVQLVFAYTTRQSRGRWRAGRCLCRCYGGAAFHGGIPLILHDWSLSLQRLRR